MCLSELGLGGRRGRLPTYCSGACRQRAYRARRAQVPAELRARRAWVRADGKRPVRPSGRPASSTDPATWSRFADVQAGAGDGYGVMLGDGLGCYDLDGVTDDTARAFLAAVPEPVIFAERSVSGRGVHIFVRAPEGPGSRRVVGGVHVERYTRARFIRTTGDRFA